MENNSPKHPIRRMFTCLAPFLLALIVLFAAAGCAGKDAKPNHPGEHTPGQNETPGTGTGTGNPPGAGGQGTTQPPEKKPTISEQAKAAVTALKDKDMNTIAKLAHPSKGVRFSPYGHIDVKKDLVFQQDVIAALMTDAKEYEWGTFDGSGEPIKLKFADYYAKFVYDADFANPEQKAVNANIGKGNTANNTTDVYPAPGHEFVEYHFTGFDAKYEGQDWKSLRLVFEKDKDQLYLVGIIHDQWTI